MPNYITEYIRGYCQGIFFVLYENNRTEYENIKLKIIKYCILSNMFGNPFYYNWKRSGNSKGYI